MGKVGLSEYIFSSLVLIFSSLIFDTDHKARLLGYMSTAILYADKNVDPNVVACNRYEICAMSAHPSRIAFLHGPPGTGKTTLCKALAHKLAIRLHER